MKKKPGQDEQDDVEAPNQQDTPAPGAPPTSQNGDPLSPPGSMGGTWNNLSLGQTKLPGSSLTGFNSAAWMGPGSDINSMIEDALRGVLQDGKTSYSPEVISAMKSEAKSTSEAGFRNAKDMLNFRHAQSGTLRAPVANREYIQARNTADQGYGQAVGKILAQKALQDHQDKMAALAAAQAHLNSLRSYIAQMNASQTQKEQYAAQLAMAEANLAEQKRQFDSKLDLEKQMGMVPVTGPDGQIRFIPKDLLGGGGLNF
jgi:hypothetical protein